MKDTAKAPGVLLLVAAAAALVVCVAGFALGQVGVGVGAVVVALLAGGAGLAWLTMEGRRVRQSERYAPTEKRGAAP